MNFMEQLKKQQEEEQRLANQVATEPEVSKLEDIATATENTQTATKAVATKEAQKRETAIQSLKKVDDFGKDLELELTNEDMPLVLEVANQITLGDNSTILSLGTEIQRSIIDSSDKMLTGLKITDTGEISEDLVNLMTAIRGEEIKEDDNFIQKFFKKVTNKKNEIVVSNMKATDLVDDIVDRLEVKADTLLTDNSYLDVMYDHTKQTYHDLTVTIQGAMQKRDELLAVTIPELTKLAEQGGDEALNELSDAREFVNRLERKIMDLNLTRTVTNQSKAQIRLIQNTNHQLSEKINSSITSAVPLWKQQLATGTVLERQREAVEAQKMVSDTTNKLLRKNADLLNLSSIETAKENERGVIDVETLEYTQQKLIDTVTQTMQIQHEGAQKRKESQAKLDTMSNDLRNSLLQAAKDEEEYQRNQAKKPRKKVN